MQFVAARLVPHPTNSRRCFVMFTEDDGAPWCLGFSSPSAARSRLLDEFGLDVSNEAFFCMFP